MRLFLIQAAIVLLINVTIWCVYHNYQSRKRRKAMIFRKELIDIVDYAYSQAHDSCICVCPTAVPDWNDWALTNEMINRQLYMLRIIRKYLVNFK